jgi:hypothetical protein
MHWRKSMSERAGLGGLSTDALATRDIYAPRDSIPSAEDILQDGDFGALCFALAAFACPFVFIGLGLVICGFLFS